MTSTRSISVLVTSLIPSMWPFSSLSMLTERGAGEVKGKLQDLAQALVCVIQSFGVL